MRLVGLDFETANRFSGSICSVGLAALDDGVLSETRDWRVRPHESLDFIDDCCYRVHNISYESLRKCPEFPEIWDSMKELLLSADCVVIHNAAFDTRHLKAVLALYQLSPISFTTLCSLRLSRRRLPELSSHTLNTVADHLGITFQHHDAYEDALTCASVACRLGIDETLFKPFEYSPAGE